MSRRQKMLDLYCCEGGAAMGYYRSGFDVFGVDHIAQRRYPFAFHLGDALVVVRRLLLGEAVPFTHPDGTVEWLVLADFAAVHASPPCQAYSVTKFLMAAGGCAHDSDPVGGVYGHGRSDRRTKPQGGRGGYTPSKPVREELMGIDWATQHGLSQAIPPAYTEFIGAQLIDHLRAVAA